MKQLHLWKTETPAWVTDYEKGMNSLPDFSGWLQFIFLPNCLLEIKERPVALQAKRFFGTDIGKGKLLQLLIELDALY